MSSQTAGNGSKQGSLRRMILWISHSPIYKKPPRQRANFGTKPCPADYLPRYLQKIQSAGQRVAFFATSKQTPLIICQLPSPAAPIFESIPTQLS
jgi:hypothetical protein